MKLSKYIEIIPNEERPDYVYLYSVKNKSLIMVDKSLLISIENDTLSASNTEKLACLGFLVSSHAEEREKMLGFFDEVNKRIKKFHAVVVLNLDCNLDCKYCYEGKMKGGHYMSSLTIDELIDFIIKRHLSFGREAYIDFYGGEPLLSYDQIKYISERLKGSSEKFGLKYSFSLVTNGTLLTKNKAKVLASLGLKSAKITIDGPNEIHNTYRPFKSGSGTFDIIINNIKESCNYTKIQLGGNFTYNNYREFPRLLDYLLDEGITPDKISFVKFDPITKRNDKFGLTDFNEGCETTNEPWLSEGSLLLREEILKRGYLTYKIMPFFCMIELRDDIVVNFDGAIYKCPGLIGLKDFKVGHIKTGIMDYKESHNIDSWKNQECLDCKYLPLCFGGCKYMKLQRDGYINGIDCKRPYLDATLKMFIKQEIKYNLKKIKDY